MNFNVLIESTCLFIYLFCKFHFQLIISLFFTFQNVPPPKGSEPNLTLGGIDLTNSGRYTFLLITRKLINVSD